MIASVTGGGDFKRSSTGSPTSLKNPCRSRAGIVGSGQLRLTECLQSGQTR